MRPAGLNSLRPASHKRAWPLVAVLCLLCIAHTARAADDTIYGVNFNSTPAVVTVNPANGAVTTVGTLAFGSAAAALDPISGLIYYTEYNPTGTSAGRVATWNPATGTNTIINATGFATQIPRLAFNNAGTLYAMDANNNLYTVNTSNGQFTLLGTVSGVAVTSGGDLAFSPNGTLYLLAGGTLYSINTFALSATSILSTGITNPTGLAFGENGLLYASDLAFNANMYTINLTTLVTSLIGTAGTLVDDLMALPKFANVSITKAASSSFVVGTTATYTLTVSNAGPQTASANITVRDTLPAGLSYSSGAGSGWACSAAGQVVTCTRSSSLGVGASSAITLTVNVLAAAAPSVSNTATVDSTTFDPATANNSSTVTTAVTSPPDLTISKTHVGNFTQGQSNATFTITVTNSGSGPTANLITVTDTLPTGLSFVSGTGTNWTCTASGQVVTCTRSVALTAGQNSPITLTVNVDSNAPASVTNTASVAVNGEVNTGNNSASNPTTINGRADLTVAKSHTGNFTQGQSNAPYTITVTNAGRAATTATITATDTLPAGLSFVSGSGTGWNNCTASGQVVTCTRTASAIPALTNSVITLLVNVSANAPASVTNSVAVSGGGESNTGNNSATDPTTITQLADLTIAKSHSGNFTQGQSNASYTLNVTNSGNGATSGTVTVTDTLPTGLSFVSGAGTDWNSCTASGQVVTCTRTASAIPALTSSAITLLVNVAANAPASVTNSVAVSGGGEIITNNNSATDPTTVTPVSDLTIAKSHTGNFTQGQSNASYTVTVTNSGLGATTSTVTVTDTLPTGLSFVSGAGTGWTSCTASGQVVTCTNSNTLNAGVSYQPLTITVNVAANAPSSVTNSVAVSGGGELNIGNNSATNPTTITQLADLTIAKSHSGNFTQGQSNAPYTITVTNSGNGPTSGTVTVTDTLPTGLSFVSSAGTGWTSCTASGQVVTCTNSNILNARVSYQPLTITVNVAANAPASVTNSVAVSGGGEIITNNNSATDPTTITQLADLTIAKSHSGNFSQGQSNAPYTITVTNSGNGPTSGTVTVTDTLPTGLSFVSGAGTGWTSCTASGQVVTCTNSNTLNAGVSYQPLTITVNVAANAPASVTNSVAVSGGGEIITNNNSATDPTTITQLADLTIAKSHSGNFSQGQSNAPYTITVTNSGNGPTSGTVTVTDTLPTGLSFVSGAGTGWTSCTASGQVITCTNSNTLNAGVSYPTLTITVNVATNAPASATNSVAVSGGGEIITNNNSATDPTTINQLADLTITKSHSGNFTQGQSNASYTITVTNSGSAATSGTVTVTDTLPAGLTATAISGTGWSCVLGTLTCNRSDALAASSSYPVITLTVNVSLSAPASVTNSASVSGGGQTNTTNDTAGDLTTINAAAPPSVGLVKSVSPGGPQIPGTDLLYTVVYTNTGGQPATNFIIVDPNMGNVVPAERVFRNVDFKLGSLTSNPGSTGMVASFEYSNNGGTTWTYSPVSGGGGAPAGYDRAVTNVRWVFAGSLSHLSPNNTGSVSLTVRIR